MSNISVRRLGELQRGVFKILLDHPDGLLAKEVIGRMPHLVPPTDFERSDYPKHPGT
jgi:restriction system protein